MVILVLAGLVLPFIIQSRAKQRSRRVARTTSASWASSASATPVRRGSRCRPSPRDELPPGTFLNPLCEPDQRMSWYVYTLNVLNEGPPSPDPKNKHRTPAASPTCCASSTRPAAWDAGRNAATGELPAGGGHLPGPGARVPARQSGADELHRRRRARPGHAGQAARRGRPLSRGVPLRRRRPRTRPSRTGLRTTAQMVETNTDLGPWLRGGPSTLRGLDLAAIRTSGPAGRSAGAIPAAVRVDGRRVGAVHQGVGRSGRLPGHADDRRRTERNQLRRPVKRLSLILALVSLAAVLASACRSSCARRSGWT